MRRGGAGAALGGDIGELAGSEVPEHDARTPGRILRQAALDLGVDVAADGEQIRPPVVVEVRHAGSPLYVAVLYAEAGDRGHILEQAAAQGPVERRNVV